MLRSLPWLPGARRGRFALPLCIVMLACFAARTGHAQAVRPWSPSAKSPATKPVASAARPARPGSALADSLASLARSARLRFERQQGDSLGGDNFDGYQIVGDLGRRLLSALGREQWRQARSIEGTLDSLGLDVELATDAELPRMVFMLVRNPFRLTSDAVGYLYWMRAGQVHMQGASYPPSHRVSFRAWNTGRQESPYEAVTVFRRRGERDLVLMRLYRMGPNGDSWDLVQYEGNTQDLGTGSRVDFTDVNQDGSPEIVAWRKAEPDSFLTLVGGVPPVIQEYIYTERPEGFVLHDIRPVPGVTETVRMFATLLVQGQPALARRLLVNPSSLDSVIAKGWGRHTLPGAWTIEYGEPSQPWPEWLALKIREDSGWKRWIFHFYIQDGRWVIRNWIPVRERDPAAVVPRPTDTTKEKRP